MANIPTEISERVPLMKEEWLPGYYRLREHREAPRWNTRCGDRLMNEDMPFILSFAGQLYNERRHGDFYPPEEILNWIQGQPSCSAVVRKNTQGIDLNKDFHSVAPMTREDLAVRLHEVVPHDISLDRLVIYDTSGTTGHSIRVPNHPRAVGCYDPMVTFCLNRYGLKPEYHHAMTACFLICAQHETITYCTVHAQLNGAGYAKINLKPSEWPHDDSAAKFIRDINPYFLAGDPISFAELMKIDLSGYQPRALLSTAMTLTDGFRKKLSAYFKCPVIDFYSLNDTGPIAYSCPLNPDTYHILPPDIFVELIGADGHPMKEDESGEITVTGGRNPFVPLLRYRTGDWARMNYRPCDCGDPMPRLYDFHGRQPVTFRNKNGQTVNPIDISKIIRRFPVVQHQFIQRADLSCVLRIRSQKDEMKRYENEIRNSLTLLFGGDLKLTVEYTPVLGDGQSEKIIPYISCVTL